MNNKKVIVVIPTYNEAHNISFLIQKISSLGLNLNILVLDDNSPDGTSKEVRHLQNEYSDLYLITRPGKFGLGTAYVEGFKYALKNGYDVIIQMDADLSHNPDYIPKMINLLDRYDLVVGSRYIKEGKTKNWSVWRIILSKFANIFSRIMLRIPIHDLTSGFKCIKSEVLKDIGFSDIASKGYAFQIEIIYRAFLKDFKIIEYPIIFQGRDNEKSKMSLGIIIESFFKVIYLSFNKIAV